MPLRVARRKDTGALVFTGTVAGRRVRESAGTDNPRTAKDLCALREAQLLRGAYLGEKVSRVTFDQAALAYLKAWPHKQRTKDNIARLLPALRGRVLTTISQDDADRLRDTLLGHDAKPATFLRSVLTPLRAVLRFAADPARGWCDPPRLGLPRGKKVGRGRTAWLTPAQATALVEAAADHLAPLLVLLLCTGARLSEALELEWEHVDLASARCGFGLLDGRGTKNGNVRQVILPPAAVAALANLPHRSGRVFLRPAFERRDPDAVDPAAPRMVAYADQERYQGGQIRRSWATACKRAGITGVTPHGCRHTWASWHHAVHRNLVRLMHDGDWSSITLVQRYAHDVPDGMDDEVRAWWGLAPAGGQERRVG